MLLDVLSPTYHIPITIDSPLRVVFPCIRWSSLVLSRERLMSGLRQFTIARRMLSAQTRDTALVNAPRCQFPKNDYPLLQRSLEPPYPRDRRRSEKLDDVLSAHQSFCVSIAVPLRPSQATASPAARDHRGRAMPTDDLLTVAQAAAMLGIRP
jgi:hypothetical protein